MKPKLLFLALLFIHTINNAQTTLIPDSSFEQALIDLGLDSGPITRQIPTANIENITSLKVNNKYISNLTGIQDFATLSILKCYNNELSVLDISNNTMLTYIKCEDNNLDVLDVSITGKIQKMIYKK